MPPSPVEETKESNSTKPEGKKAEKLDQQALATPPAALPATDKVLDGYLQSWERAMKEVTSLAAKLERTDRDRTFETTTKLVGEFFYMKVGAGATALNLARLEMRPDGKKEFQEKFVWTGTCFYQFVPAHRHWLWSTQNELRVYELPKPKLRQVDDAIFPSLFPFAIEWLPLKFLFGMKAEEAKRRCVLKLTKEDKYYIYVDITPRFAVDRADFQRARLVLNKNNFLPRQLWFQHYNGNEVIWDIPTLQKNVKLDRRDFDAPKTPDGWKLVPVGREMKSQPPIVRPSSGK